MKGVILAGGRGTRLRPITHTGPKQLIPVVNKPVLQYAIEDLRSAGITDIGVVLGNKGRDAIQRFLGNGSQFGVSITYIVQGDPLGLAHAVGCSRTFVKDDDFVVYLGDNITKYGIDGLVRSFESEDCAASISVQAVDVPERFGIVEINDDGEIIEIVEKPENPPSNLALIGTFVFSPAIFGAIERIDPSERGELEITDAIRILLDDGETIDSNIVDSWWKDTGKPEDIIDANRFLLEEISDARAGTVEVGADVTGRVDLHETARIEADSVVRGPVSIAEDTAIKAGAYVGPYTSIGPQSVVERTHIENSVVIGESEIRTEQRIVDSLIGRKTAIRDGDDQLPEGRRIVVGENTNLSF